MAKKKKKEKKEEIKEEKQEKQQELDCTLLTSQFCVMIPKR